MPMAMANWRVRMLKKKGGGVETVLGASLKIDLKVKADVNSSMGLGQ